ncbi:MAG: cytochrome c biogenesis protein CcdA [Thermoplasmatota archaeon]
MLSRDSGLTFYLIAAAVVLIIIFSVFFYTYGGDSSDQEHDAQNFSAVDLDGENITLSDFEGEVVVLHITNIENPLCLECEEELKAQCRELNELDSSQTNVTIITVNMRKNPYSEPGGSMVEENWDIDVTWHWIEDHEPYDIAGKYMDYWNLDGGVSNPTVLLIDGDQDVVGMYHVYQMGKGKVDGIQTADTLESDIQQIESGEWEEQQMDIGGSKITLVGMFALGVVTSFSPCSIALLVAMLSYIMASIGKEENGDENDGKNKKKDHSKEGFLIGVFFTIGMASVFFLLGIFLSYVGIFIKNSAYFYLGSGVLLVLLGINNMYPLSEMFRPITDKIYKSKGATDSINDKIRKSIVSLFDNSLILAAFLLGVFFALAWAPCAISLILPVFIWVVSEGLPFLLAGLMLFVFGLGHGAPIIPLAVVSRSARASIGEKYISMGKKIEVIFGVAIIIIGVIMALRFFGFYLW